MFPRTARNKYQYFLGRDMYSSDTFTIFSCSFFNTGIWPWTWSIWFNLVPVGPRTPHWWWVCIVLNRLSLKKFKHFWTFSMKCILIPQTLPSRLIKIISFASYVSENKELLPTRCFLTCIYCFTHLENNTNCSCNSCFCHLT